MKLKLVKKRSGKVVRFKKEKITNAIFEAAKSVGGSNKELSAKLANKVVELIRKDVRDRIPTVEQIQDKAEKVLIEEGHAKTAKSFVLYREKRKNIRETSKLLRDISVVEDYVKEIDWRVRENSNMTYSLQGLNVHITDTVISNYWLNSIYPPEIREGHINGDYHIHDLGTLGAYTYFGKETIIARIEGKIMITSFQELYEKLQYSESLLSLKDNAWAKYPEKIEVLDKNGWTRVKRVVKKSKDKPMRFVKNEGGRSVIVTEDHPMIKEGTVFVESRNIQENSDKLLTVDVSKLLDSEKIFYKNTLNLAEELVNRGISNFWVEGLPCEEFFEYAKEIPSNAIISTSNNAGTLPNSIPLTKDLGYLIGFYIAEGWMEPHRVSIKQKSTNANVKIISKLKKAAYKIGCRVYAREKEGFITLQFVNSTFTNYLMNAIFDLKDISKNKKLPREILTYNKEFVRGVIAGIIDGDGSVATSKTSIIIRTASRTLLEQLSTVLNILGYTVRDRNIEGVGSTRIYKGKTITQQYPLYGISFRTLEKQIPSFKYQSASLSTKAWRSEGVGWHKVLNNEETEIQDENIYDITTESNTLVVNGMWNHNCVGWDLKDLLLVGFKGVRGKIESKPAKHFDVALMQLVNFLYTMQGEAAGAQAVSNFDTLLSPFIRYDNLNEKEVRQSIQKFLFNMNVPTRVGFQTPFTNITLDLTCPKYMENEQVIVGGKLKKETYKEFNEERDLLNRVLAEEMNKGDAKGRPFTFPIPTYNITKNFDWDNKNYEAIWEMTSKYGIPYFANFVNSSMEPDDARSMCCRLRLDKRELKKRGGGLFGSNPLTGSIGVVTVNLPRLAHTSKSEEEFFDKLGKLMDKGMESLIIKRNVLERFTESGLYPYSKFYLRNIYKAYGEYWKNHFSTIGLVGMNDALLNFINSDVSQEKGVKFAEKVLEFMRDRLADYQEETGDIFNLEATPAEGTSYRLARMDSARYPDIKIFNQEKYTSDAEPYYTNSSQLPVGHTDDMFRALKLQDPLQTKYTGGTVLHGFLGESLPSVDAVKSLVRKVSSNFHLPYFTITPTFSICPKHGYISGEHEYCPKCDEEIKITTKGGTDGRNKNI